MELVDFTCPRLDPALGEPNGETSGASTFGPRTA